MTPRDEQTLAVYLKFRHDDQRNFYDRTSTEFEAAHEQGVDLAAWLMAASALVGLAAAAADRPEQRALLAVLGTALPAMSSALAAYVGLYAFDQQVKLYRDAAVALLRARADAPDLRANLTEPEYRRASSMYINRVEGVLRREQAQWGQLISELQVADPGPDAEQSATQT
jgi:hypothetical protein